MMNKGSLLFLVLVMTQIGAVSTDQKSDEAGRKSKRNNSAFGPQGFVSDSVVHLFGPRKTGKELMREKKLKGSKSAALQGQQEEGKEGAGGVLGAAPAAGPVAAPVKIFQMPSAVKGVNVPSVPKVYAVPKIYKIEKPFVAPPPAPRVAVPQIRQEIQKILDLNKQIKTMEGGRAGQFQRVQEQARIHQRILNQIEATPASEAESGGISTVTDKEDLLAQEKLRIIHEETQRNAALLEAAGGETEGGGDATVEPVSPFAQKPRSL